MCLEVYCDASYHENKKSKIAFIIKDDMCKVHESCNAIVTNGCYEAELKALDFALDYLLDNKLNTKALNIYSDCQPAVEVINKDKKIKSRYKKLITVIKNKLKILKDIYNCTLQWISRKFNKDADEITRSIKLPQQPYSLSSNLHRGIVHNGITYRVPPQTEKMFPIDNIKVPGYMLRSKPDKVKVNFVKNYYSVYLVLDKPIKINECNELKDGYIRYAIAKEIGLNLVPVYGG
jgi:ribonuclease HI